MIFFMLTTSSTPAHSEECARLDRSVDAELFAAEYCTACNDARRFLQRNGLPFREHDARTPEIWRRLNDGAGKGEMPALRVCGEWFFGFTPETERQILRLFRQKV